MEERGERRNIELIELRGKVATHSMRKTFADRVYEALGRDIFRTQKALGHRNINSTVQYLSFKEQDIEAAILGMWTRYEKRSIYTVKMLAQKLAVKPLTIYRLIADGKLPAMKIGRSIRFDPAEIDIFLKTVRVNPETSKERNHKKRKWWAPEPKRLGSRRASRFRMAHRIIS
jgi:excisionase family DNA binding protein